MASEESFEQRLRGMIDTTLHETEAFLSQWGKTRSTIVEPSLRTAEGVLRSTIRDAIVEPKNGTIGIRAAYSNFEHLLRFKPNTDRLEIECAKLSYPKTTVAKEEEAEIRHLSLAEMTVTAVEDIIQEVSVYRPEFSVRLEE
jgi:hypothetical protein